MDTTVSGIGAVVVAELRAAGYMESTVGQYTKTIKALTEFASGRDYSTSLGAEFASMTTSPLPRAGLRSSYSPELVTIETDDADPKTVEAMLSPRYSFAAQDLKTPWSMLQLAYFARLCDVDLPLGTVFTHVSRSRDSRAWWLA